MWEAQIGRFWMTVTRRGYPFRMRFGKEKLS